MKTQKIVSSFFQKPYRFKRLTTLSLEEFEMLAKKLEPAWKESERRRLEFRPNRKRKVGQGRPYTLGSFRNLLFVTILYLRTGASMELLSLIFRADDDSLRRPITRILPLVQDRFIPKSPIAKGKKRINDLDELLALYSEFEDVIVDGTEFSTQRPKKRQRQSYSGKKKRHTKKSQVAFGKDSKLILGVSPPKKGKVHDKKQLEQTGWDKKIPKQVKRYGDLGYLGMDKESGGIWILPHKKPRGKTLTRKQKQENKRIAKERIFVEHAIRRIKVFRRVGETITTKSDNLFSLSLFACVNLANFKWLVRQELG